MKMIITLLLSATVLLSCKKESASTDNTSIEPKYVSGTFSFAFNGRSVSGGTKSFYLLPNDGNGKTYLHFGGNTFSGDVIDFYIQMPAKDIAVGSYTTFRTDFNFIHYDFKYASNGITNYAAWDTSSRGVMNFNILTYENKNGERNFTCNFSGTMIKRFFETPTPFVVSDGTISCRTK